MNFSKIKLQMLKEKNFDYNSRVIKSAKDIVKTVNEYEELEKATEESILLICLNCKNQIVAYSELAKGGINFCNLEFKTIFKTILLCNANRFIMVHNHPSGIATPSQNDINITIRLKDVSRLMGIDFLDHIVIGANNDFASCMSSNI